MTSERVTRESYSALAPPPRVSPGGALAAVRESNESAAENIRYTVGESLARTTALAESAQTEGITPLAKTFLIGSGLGLLALVLVASAMFKAKRT